MKLERILEIIIYLLNHEKVSAKYLAEYFDVSVRTIQRDMVSIAEAGIPVYTLGGRYGGYAVLENYKIKNINIKNSEQQIIISALESLATSYTNDKLNSLIEKYNAIIEKEGGQKVFWDFSVTKENKKVQDSNMLLEKASAVRTISFSITAIPKEKVRMFVRSPLQFIINGMHGICLHTLKKQKSIEPLRLLGCKT